MLHLRCSSARLQAAYRERARHQAHICVGGAYSPNGHTKVYKQTHLRARPTDLLDTVLAHMLKRRQHMAIVSDEVGTFLGIITLEDIIEEVIQQEILDEDD